LEAMILACNTAADDIIDFDPAVFTQGSLHTITLNQGELGYFASGGKLTINGPGADVLKVAGAGSARIFSFDTGTDVKLLGMTVSGGLAGGTGSGGGIASGGTLSLIGMVVTGNTLHTNPGTPGDSVTPGTKGL